MKKGVKVCVEASYHESKDLTKKHVKKKITEGSGILGGPDLFITAKWLSCLFGLRFSFCFFCLGGLAFDFGVHLYMRASIGVIAFGPGALDLMKVLLCHRPAFFSSSFLVSSNSTTEFCSLSGLKLNLFYVKFEIDLIVFNYDADVLFSRNFT